MPEKELTREELEQQFEKLESLTARIIDDFEDIKQRNKRLASALLELPGQIRREALTEVKKALMFDSLDGPGTVNTEYNQGIIDGVSEDVKIIDRLLAEEKKE